MRSLLVLALVSAAIAGCTPYIPVERDFGTSGLAPPADVPSDFAAFNNYDPSVAALVAEQICATPYIRTQEKSVGAAPGRMVEETGQCATHAPLVGSGGPLPPWNEDR